MIETLEQLLQDEIRDIYDAEKQLVKAIPKMAKAASSTELSDALKQHLEATQGHVQRLEQVFEALGTKAKGKTCAAMKGLIEEGQEAIGADSSDEMKDLAIIGAAQRVEHYEIAAYGTVRTFAEQLGKQDVVDLLQSTLDEEKEADDKLSDISQTLLDVSRKVRSRTKRRRARGWAELRPPQDKPWPPRRNVAREYSTGKVSKAPGALWWNRSCSENYGALTI
jgi:ferritin-like metal-binding protein YciE